MNFLQDQNKNLDSRNSSKKLVAGYFNGTIHFYVKNVDSVVERSMAAGAKLIRSVEDMFYGDRSGGVEDPYGHKWYVATHIEDLSLAKIKKRAAELFSKNN